MKKVLVALVLTLSAFPAAAASCPFDIPSRSSLGLASANLGTSWSPPTLSPGLGVALLMDPQLPTRLYVGRHEYGTLNGGLFRSSDSGKTYMPIGLEDVTVADVALNGSGSRIYAATYGSGIYVSAVP